MPNFGKYNLNKITKINNFKQYSVRLFLFILVVIGNYWTHFLFSHNLTGLIIVISISVLLFISDYLKKFKYLIFLLPLIYIIFSFNYKNTVFNLSPEEIYFINQRRAYFPNLSVGKIYENKLFRFSFNYQKNIFEGLDINYYFFGTHPRERVGITEIRKFPFVYLPFFIVGLFSLLKKQKFIYLLYFLSSIFLASFFRPIDIYSFLFFPFMAICIFNGFLYLDRKEL